MIIMNEDSNGIKRMYLQENLNCNETYVEVTERVTITFTLTNDDGDTVKFTHQMDVTTIDCSFGDINSYLTRPSPAVF